MEIKDSAKTILCYGDSNTWGNVPGNSERYPRSKRWTNILQNLLGDNYEVISEGLPGRTFVAVEPQKPYKSGIIQLRSIIRSHQPVYTIIVMLGTNDLKERFNLTAKDVCNHLEETIKLIKEEKIENVLIICPPEIVIPQKEPLRADFMKGKETIKDLPKLFREVAEKYKCDFINAQDFVFSSKIDGFHLEPEAHKKLAEVLRDEILRII